ncbi:MAG: hypothetical protein M5U01_40525 [Ardenticatenaceae bacterium]|nr:hypothetical protein [Ardenticatenaceae bacterium]
MSEPRADYDNPWKDVLEQYFEAFMALFFPAAHADIDWARGYEFLDTELRQVVREAVVGPRRVDKLVRVWRQGGAEAWVLVYVEVQSQAEASFARRMYVYHYRLFDRYERLVASLAVLGDEQPGWRPDHFGSELWGCQAQLRFPSVKLLDYRARWALLEASPNPFATVVMAHLKSQETRGDAVARQQWKLALTRQRYARGYGRADVLRLFQFIDWVMQLPAGLEESFWRELRQFEEETQMPYITSVERLGMQKGLEQGRQEGLRAGLRAGIEVGLELKFGPEAAPLARDQPARGSRAAAGHPGPAPNREHAGGAAPALSGRGCRSGW